MNYQEKTFAAGKIPGGFFKREGRPSEKEILTSRLIDRPIRPLFVEGFKNETQVIVTVLSHDMENDPDILALVAASAALTLSGVPFLGPIAAARVGLIGGEFVLNPMLDEMAESALDLVVAGTQDAVMMVELEAKELSEKQMLEAVMFGHKHFQPVIQAIIKLAETAAKEPWDIQLPDAQKFTAKVKKIAEADLQGRLRHQGEAEALRPDRSGEEKGEPRASRSATTPARRCCSPTRSRRSRARSCAATSSRTGGASTGAT